jgi:hypothetical protein
MTGELPAPAPKKIMWYNRYELDENGFQLPEEEQYGGGGPMSEDYKDFVKTYTSMGWEKPWTIETQRRITGGLVLVHPSERATYQNSFKRGDN